MKPQVGSLDHRTGTTIDERRRIRAKHKADKVKTARGIRTRSTSPEYRENIGSVDFFRGIASRFTDEQAEERAEAEHQHRLRCYNPECSCHL